MPLIKKLTPVGNGQAIVLDQPLLDQLGLERGDSVELQLEGQTLLVRRASKEASESRAARLDAARTHLLAMHGGTLKKLAN